MRCLAVLLSLLPLSLAAADATAPSEDRWAKEMQRFQEQDKAQPAQDGGVVFVGSSSIRLWNLDESFPELEALNRGFGGSQIDDSVRHLDLLVLRHKPRVVVFYAGDNDVNGGKSPETVVKDFETFVARIHDELPDTRIVYIAIKPSRARWKLADKMQEANAGIAAVCKRSAVCEYVDVWPAMLGEDGEPRQELFVKDGLHLSPQGYAIWTELVAPHLE